MAITDLPTPPSRLDPTTFAARGDAFLAALPTFATEANELQADVNAKQVSAAANANAAQQDRVLVQDAKAAIDAQSPITNAAAAAASAQAAAESAGIAQAVSPDSPVRFNTRAIIADLTIASAYNAASVGPITIAPGITVTVQDNATWSIN